MGSFAGPLWIGPVSDEDRTEALRLALAEQNPNVPSTSAQRGGEKLEKQGEDRLLWGAYRGAQLVGALLGQIQPGRTAVVRPPRLTPPELPEVGLALVEGICQELAGRGVCLAYTFLEEDQGAESRLMQVAGFFLLAHLLYLAAPESEFPSVCPTSELCFEPYGPENHARLLRTMEATYIDTLDCPRLNRKRDMEDTVAGYRATGTHRPELWYLVRNGEEDVGCLLLTDHPEQESLELIYMGLVPSARGRGWGTEVVRYAQWLTRFAGRAQLLLGVDAENWPAIRVYAAAGFLQWAQRMVYARFLEQ